MEDFSQYYTEETDHPRSSGQAWTSRIRLIPFKEITLSKSRRYLVKGLIPRVGLTVVWGPPKSGKSFWTFDLCMHVALGHEYRGRRVHKGAVVYCAFEGQTGIEARVAAFRQRTGIVGNVPFYLEPVTLNLVRHQQELINVIKLQLGIERPAVITLDTLNRSLEGSESNDEDMSAYVRAADALREAFECAIIIVHHCGIDGSRPRGHTSLTGATDAQLAVRRDAAGSIIVTVEYMKDGPTGDDIMSTLEVVDVGIDEDGEPVTSCVIVPAEGEEVGGGRKVPGTAKIALEALQLAIDEAGELPPIPGRQNRTKKAVRSTLWRRYCERLQISEADTPDSKRKAWKRAADKLQELKIIGVWDDWIWIA